MNRKFFFLSSDSTPQRTTPHVGPAGPRGCPGPMGPAGPQPSLSDALDSPARDVAASSLAIRTVYERTRTQATADVTLYVRTMGDDAADGLSPATAKASIRGALDEAGQYDLHGFGLTIDVGSGEFAAPGALSGLSVSSGDLLTIRGQDKDSSVIEGGWQYSGRALLRLQHMTLSVSKGSAFGFLVQASDQASLWLEGVRLRGTREENACNGLIASHGANILFQGAENELEGCFHTAILIEHNALVSSPGLLTVSGPLRCRRFIHVYHYGLGVFTGGFANHERVTGQKWYAASGGQVLYANGTWPETFFPGDADGFSDGAAQIMGNRSLTRAWSRTTAAGSLNRACNMLACEKRGAGIYRYACAFPVSGAALPLLCFTGSDGRQAHGWVEDISGANFTVRTSLNGTDTDLAHAVALWW